MLTKALGEAVFCWLDLVVLSTWLREAPREGATPDMNIDRLFPKPDGWFDRRSQSAKLLLLGITTNDCGVGHEKQSHLRNRCPFKTRGRHVSLVFTHYGLRWFACGCNAWRTTICFLRAYRLFIRVSIGAPLH